MNNDIFIIFLALIAGAFIEIFFRLVKYKDSFNKNSPKPRYSSYNNYQSVTEFVAGGNRKWLGYILFRSMPPFIILTMFASFLARYFSNQAIFYPVILAAFISLFPRDIYCLFLNKKTWREKLIHAMNILLVIMIAYLVTTFYGLDFLKYLAPSASGLVDNLWSSILVALLVIFYFEVTNQRTKINEDHDEVIARDNYILNSFKKINTLYGDIINSECIKYNCPKPLLYAVLIYENMNRPVLFRSLENILIRVFKKPMTVGIAQVMSKTPLTDRESIQKAAKIIGEADSVDPIDFIGPWTYSGDMLIVALGSYNKDPCYRDNIYKILSSLRTYAYEVFL